MHMIVPLSFFSYLGVCFLLLFLNPKRFGRSRWIPLAAFVRHNLDSRPIRWSLRISGAGGFLLCAAVIIHILQGWIEQG